MSTRCFKTVSASLIGPMIYFTMRCDCAEGDDDTLKQKLDTIVINYPNITCKRDFVSVSAFLWALTQSEIQTLFWEARVFNYVAVFVCIKGAIFLKLI